MSKIIGSELKNIPWEEKPEGYSLQQRVQQRRGTLWGRLCRYLPL